MPDNNKEKQSSPSWELFWQQHGESLLKQEEEEKAKKEIMTGKTEKELKEKDRELPELLQPAAVNINSEQKETPDKEPKKKEIKQKRLTLAEKIRSLDNKKKTRLVISLCILAFVVVTLGSGFAVYEKLQKDKAELTALIEEKTDQIQTENEQAFADINQRLSEMGSEIDDLIVIMEDTDEAIVESGAESREALSEKISQLDKQLNELKKSLAILMEDQNAQ